MLNLCVHTTAPSHDIHSRRECHDSADASCSPDPLVSVPPKRNHFVNLEGSGPMGAAHGSPQGAVLHLGQEILGKRASHIVLVPVLQQKKRCQGSAGHHVIPIKLCASSWPSYRDAFPPPSAMGQDHGSCSTGVTSKVAQLCSRARGAGMQRGQEVPGKSPRNTQLAL